MRRGMQGTGRVAWVVLATACAPGDQTPPEGGPASMPAVVALTSTEYHFEAPDTIPAGWATFRMINAGGEVHYGHIVQLEEGRTVEELVAAYLHAIRTSGPRPAWVTRFGGPGGVAPGDSARVTQWLEPGSYVWVCPVEDATGTPHFAMGEVREFEVRAAGDAPKEVSAPASGLEIRLLDFGFAVDTPVRAGRHVVRVTNSGIEPHDLVMLRLAPGRTIEDIEHWLNPERARRAGSADEPPPSLDQLGTGAGGVAAMAPGLEAFVEADLAPGAYVLLCMATAPDGRSHIEHGMIRQVLVQ